MAAQTHQSAFGRGGGDYRFVVAGRIADGATFVTIGSGFAFQRSIGAEFAGTTGAVELGGGRLQDRFVFAQLQLIVDVQFEAGMQEFELLVDRSVLGWSNTISVKFEIFAALSTHRNRRWSLYIK